MRNDPARPEEHIKSMRTTLRKVLTTSYQTIHAHCTTGIAATEIISTKWDLRTNVTTFPVPEHESNYLLWLLQDSASLEKQDEDSSEDVISLPKCPTAYNSLKTGISPLS